MSILDRKTFTRKIPVSAFLVGLLMAVILVTPAFAAETGLLVPSTITSNAGNSSWTKPVRGYAYPAAIYDTIQLVGISVMNNGGGSSSLTIDKPSNVVSGDVLVGQVVARKASTQISPPAGWTLIRTDHTSASLAAGIYYHVTTTSEPSAYTWNFSSSQQAVGGIARFTGVDPTSPVDAHSGLYNDSNNILTAPTVTTTTPADMVLFFGSVTPKATVTTPAGMNGGWQSPASNLTAYMANQLLTTNGATGNRVGVASNSGNSNISQLVALRPNNKNSATSTPTNAPTATATQGGGTVTIGDTNILSTDDSGNGNLLLAQQTTLLQSATIQSLSFYVTTAVGNLRLGIYDDAGGNPGTLKAQTADFTPVVGWNTQNVVTPIQLPAGTYWLAYLPQSSSLHFRNDSSGTARWYSYAYGPLPTTYSTSPQSGTYHWSFYGSLLVSTAPTSTPLPTATNTPLSTATKTSTPAGTATNTRTLVPTNTPTPATIGQTILAINSGGSAVGSFVADTDAIGGSGYTVNATIDTSGATNPAPQAVYQSERWGEFTYTIPNLTPNASYTVRLHFAETYWTTVGQRQFNVSINGNQVLGNFDIIADVGAPDKADIKQFSAVANAGGQIVVTFSNGAADNPKVSGIEVVSSNVNPLPTNTPSPSSTSTSTSSNTSTPMPTPGGSPAYPLKVSANKRYLVDQNNAPFLIAGDSPQGLMALSPSDQQTYLSSRRGAGVNSIWVSLLCTTYSSICPSINAYGGIAPFTTPGDLSTPNPAYFTEVDSMVHLAAQYGMTVFLDPIETGGWLTVLESNGATKDYNYGVYLGNRYKNFANIVWLNGNDFQTWQNSTDDADVSAVAKGIKSVDTSHIQTVELNFDTSGSLDDSTWAPIIALDSAYSYYPQYAQVLTEYNRANFVPVYFIEGVYEYQGYQGGYLGSYTLRNQEYWTQLSGSTGQLYGNANLFGFPSGWKTSNWQTSPGIVQFGYAKNFFASRQWYNLVPDQNHSVVTAGYGTFSNCCINANSDYVTAARSTDGKLVVAYMPTVRTITVNMAQLSGAVTARWYDPTTGTYGAIAGSPFANSGSRNFTPPGKNSSGDGDWLLVLEAN